MSAHLGLEKRTEERIARQQELKAQCNPILVVECKVIIVRPHLGGDPPGSRPRVAAIGHVTRRYMMIYCACQAWYGIDYRRVYRVVSFASLSLPFRARNEALVSLIYERIKGEAAISRRSFLHPNDDTTNPLHCSQIGVRSNTLYTVF